MSPRAMKARFLAELIEICRSIDSRCDELAAFLGTDTIGFFEAEVERMRKLVLDLSNATAKRNA